MAARLPLTRKQLAGYQKELDIFRQAFDFIPDHVVITDKDANILYANESVEQNTGYSRDEIMGKNPDDLWGGKMPKDFYEKMWRRIKTEKKPFVGEIINKRKDGRDYWVELRIVPVLDEKGEARFFIGFEPNITYRKQREEEMLESLGDGVIAIDRGWKIIYLNSAAAGISGFTKEEVLGKPFRNIIKLVRERDREENITFIEDAIVKGKVRSLEENTFLIARDGREIPVGNSAAPILDQNGEVSGAVIIFRDRSKEIEAQMLKSSFAYASHQLRTPVTKALWNLEIAREEKDLRLLNEYIETAYVSMKSVQKLVGELVDVSELDQGFVIPKLQTIGLADLLADVTKQKNEKAKSRNISIILEPVSPALNLRTDRKMLARVLLEIIDNAVLYSRPDGEVKINAGPRKDGILIEVRDFGIGIPQVQQALIFTKFFRGANFDNTNIIGAGLGLYLSQSYIKLLGGKIWFTSKENEGTAFSVFLPLGE